MNSKFQYLLVILLVNLAFSLASEVFSCGGFVKLGKNIEKGQINYEDIKVKLISSINDKVLETTECSPNGYYFLPIYEKGNYYFEIDAPKGWSFKNKRISLNFKNEEQCTTEDFNFELVGFQVDGFVGVEKNCRSQRSGLAGIKVDLISKKSIDQAVLQTETNDEGYFRFDSASPSEYEVQVAHPSYTFAKASHSFSFKWGNYRVESGALQVEGFDLVGSIINEERAPMKSVTFKLMSGKNVVATDKSREKGEFKFSGLRCGEYQLLPEYKGSDANQNYDISPRSMEVLIDAGGLKINEPFQVLGFSVSGRVVNHLDEGVEGVAISVNGEYRTVTDSLGAYTLDKVSTGKYSIEARKENIQFESLSNFRLSASTVKLPEIKVKSYHLCGQVLVPKAIPGVKVNPREITLQSGTKGAVSKVQTDTTGKFCFEVVPGTYTVAVALSAHEKSKGLQFTSHSITATIVNKPQLDLIFSQSRSTIQGKIKVIKADEASPAQPQITVSLTCLSRKDDEVVNIAPVLSKSGDYSFSFRELLPGSYKVHVDCDAWCWASESAREQTVEIQSNEEVKEVEFQQGGFQFTVTSPTDTPITMTHTHPSHKYPATQLKKGSNDLCLKHPGQHKFAFESCFQFAQPTFTYNTAAQKKGVLNLEIKKVLIQGLVKGGPFNQSSDLSVQVLSDGKVIATVPTTSVADAPVLTHAYEYYADVNADLALHFQPVSTNKDMLFYPASVNSIPSSGNKYACVPKTSDIAARKGLFIHGKVNPNIEGVEVTASVGERVVKTVKTSASGAYSLGPLYDDQEYTLRASKEGFNFHRKDPKAHDFDAVELGSFEITIQDAVTKAPVSGVLVSLSGEDAFRQTLISTATGKIEFAALYPGSYFLKAVLKEYSLTPSSQTIEIVEGKQQRLNILATRVAFSVYGTVSALNEMKQAGIVVAAYDQDKLVEESPTNDEGFFRIRGLLPNKSYQIRVADERVDRSTPAFRSVVPGKEDIDNIDFVVLPAEGTFDLTGTLLFNTSDLVTSSGILPIPVRVSLYSGADTDKALVNSVDLHHSTFFDLGSISKSKKNLFLQIEPLNHPQQHSQKSKEQSQTSPNLTFKSKLIPVEVKSNSVHIKTQIHFEKLAGLQIESVSVPYFGLILFVLFIITCLYPSKVWNLLISLRTLGKKSKYSKKQKKVDDADDSFLPKELRNLQKEKKKNK